MPKSVRDRTRAPEVHSKPKSKLAARVLGFYRGSNYKSKDIVRGDTTWKFVKSATKFQLSAGTYFVGDLCHVLSDDVWAMVADKGLYDAGDNKFFAMASTSSGDGIWGRVKVPKETFCVDSGTIGIAPLAVCTRVAGLSLGQVYKFTQPVKCEFCPWLGTYEFTSGRKHVLINTERDSL